MIANRLRLFLLACLIVVNALPLSAQNQVAKMPQLVYKDRTLPNGLRVLSIIDH